VFRLCCTYITMNQRGSLWGWGRTSESAADVTRFKVPITQVGILKSHARDRSDAWFGSGGEGSAPLTAHDLASAQSPFWDQG
jgi:hypothetical protein